MRPSEDTKLLITSYEDEQCFSREIRADTKFRNDQTNRHCHVNLLERGRKEVTDR